MISLILQFSKLIWGSSWGRGFRFHRFRVRRHGSAARTAASSGLPSFARRPRGAKAGAARPPGEGGRLRPPERLNNDNNISNNDNNNNNINNNKHNNNNSTNNNNNSNNTSHNNNNHNNNSNRNNHLAPPQATT